MTARWVAAALNKDLLTIDLGALMSHELGRSAINLQVALRTAARSDAVLFIDELDAVAKARGDGSDVGEARRLVNVFLMELDQWPQSHLLIGATNHPELLDRAVDRRFERKLYLSAPDLSTRTTIIRSSFPHWPDADAPLFAEITDGLTGSEISSLSLRAKRAAAHRGEVAASLVDAVASLETASPRTKTQRHALIQALHDRGFSDRAIASAVGVTHPTVAASLRAND